MRGEIGYRAYPYQIWVSPAEQSLSHRKRLAFRLTPSCAAQASLGGWFCATSAAWGRLTGSRRWRRGRERVVKFAFELCARESLVEVGRDADAVLLGIEQLHGLLVLARAKDKADRCVFALAAFVTIKPGEVDFYLAFVAGVEVADLEFDGDESAQSPMIEEQVEVVVDAVHAHPLLSGDEGEAHSQSEKEGLHLTQDGGLEVLLGVGILKPEEIEQVEGARNTRSGVSRSSSRLIYRSMSYGFMR